MSRRVLTALLLVPIALLALGAHSPWPILGLALLASIRATVELKRLFPSRLPDLQSVAVGLGLLAAGWFLPGQAWLVLSVLISSISAVLLWNGKSRHMYSLGLLWLYSAFVTALYVHWTGRIEGADWSFLHVFALLVPHWAGDSCAYAVGRVFGKRKLAPEISPNKTWEGAFGHLVGTVAITVFFGQIWDFSVQTSVILGVLMSVFGQLGDLLQSRMKRMSGLKDTGALLPGHGGVLDRIDSFLLAAPYTALTMYTLMPSLFAVKP